MNNVVMAASNTPAGPGVPGHVYIDNSRPAVAAPVARAPYVPGATEGVFNTVPLGRCIPEGPT